MGDLRAPVGRAACSAGVSSAPSAARRQTRFPFSASASPRDLSHSTSGLAKPSYPGAWSPRYLRKHLKALHRAIDAGVNLKGYYAWSLMDSLEWSLGFSKRFGLYHVDFATQKRTPKATAKHYAKVIESNGSVLDG